MGVLSSGEAGKSPISIAHTDAIFCLTFLVHICSFPFPPTLTLHVVTFVHVCVCVCVCVGLTASGSTSGGHYVWAGIGGVGGAGLAVQ